MPPISRRKTPQKSWSPSTWAPHYSQLYDFNPDYDKGASDYCQPFWSFTSAMYGCDLLWHDLTQYPKWGVPQQLPWLYLPQTCQVPSQRYTCTVKIAQEGARSSQRGRVDMRQSKTTICRALHEARVPLYHYRLGRHVVSPLSILGVFPRDLTIRPTLLRFAKLWSCRCSSSCC